MNELFILVAMAVTFAGVAFGAWQNSNLWLNNSKNITRKECRGKLYWVIEDGDVEKFNHVADCFEKSN